MPLTPRSSRRRVVLSVAALALIAGCSADKAVPAAKDHPKTSTSVTTSTTAVAGETPTSASPKVATVGYEAFCEAMLVLNTGFAEMPTSTDDLAAASAAITAVADSAPAELADAAKIWSGAFLGAVAATLETGQTLDVTISGAITTEVGVAGQKLYNAAGANCPDPTAG